MRTPTTRYVVELRRPDVGWSELPVVVDRARQAAGATRRAGIDVRVVRSVYVPEDDTCLLVVDAPDERAAVALLALAGLVAGPARPTITVEPGDP